MQCILRREDSLSAMLAVPRGLTALVGGGGKTTLMQRLANELAAQGARVLVSTSTHIWLPEGMRMLPDPATEEIRQALTADSPVCVGSYEQKSGKLVPCGVPWETLSSLCDYVLVEADGAKGMPLKAPAAHEPVLPPCTRLVIAVAGMDGAEGTIAEKAFRAERYAALLGTDMAHRVLPAEIARVLADKEGQRKDVPQGARFVAALNKAGTPERAAAAHAVGEALEKMGIPYVIVA